MSNLGKQFITLYRGVGGAKPEHIDTTNPGIHWTPDVSQAISFADPDHPFNAGAEHPDDGVVLKARVDKSHVVQRGTEEHEKLSNEHMILDEEHHEKEVTVRPGAPVKVTRLMHFKYGANGDFKLHKEIPFKE
jgi:hypothetical protein